METDTGHRDAKGRAIFRGPRGGLFVRTAGGGKAKPAFGKNSNRASRANLVEAHRFFHAGGHPSMNRRVNAPVEDPAPPAPRARSPARNPPRAPRARSPARNARPALAPVRPMTLQEIHAQLPEEPSRLCYGEEIPYTLESLRLGPHATFPTRGLLRRLLASSPTGEVEVHAAGLTFYRFTDEDEQTLCDRKFKKIAIRRADPRNDVAVARRMYRKYVGGRLPDDHAEVVRRLEAAGVADADIIATGHLGFEAVRSVPRSDLGEMDDDPVTLGFDGYGRRPVVVTWVTDDLGPVTRIQAAVRGHLARKKYAQMLHEHYAPGGAGMRNAMRRATGAGMRP